jgi:hypothetical protein
LADAQKQQMAAAIAAAANTVLAKSNFDFHF